MRNKTIADSVEYSLLRPDERGDYMIREQDTDEEAAVDTYRRINDTIVLFWSNGVRTWVKVESRHDHFDPTGEGEWQAKSDTDWPVWVKYEGEEVAR